MDVRRAVGPPLFTAVPVSGLNESAGYSVLYFDEADRLNGHAKKILGGSWDMWWLLTPLPGVVWCNCPHMRGYDTTSVEDLTKAEASKRIGALQEKTGRGR